MSALPFDVLQTKVQTSVGDCHDNLAAYDLPLEVGVSVVPVPRPGLRLAGAVVGVLDGPTKREPSSSLKRKNGTPRGASS